MLVAIDPQFIACPQSAPHQRQSLMRTRWLRTCSDTSIQPTGNETVMQAPCQCPPGDCSPIANLLRGYFHRLFQHRPNLTFGPRDLREKSHLCFSLARETVEGSQRILPGELPVVKPDAIERCPGLQNREQIFQIHAAAPVHVARAPQNHVGIGRLGAHEPQRAGAEVRFLGVAQGVGIMNHGGSALQPDQVESDPE